MKKLITLMMAMAILHACSGPEEAEKKPLSTNTENANGQIGGQESAPAPVPAPASDTSKGQADLQKVEQVAQKAPPPSPGKDGEKLIKGSDCLTCHKNDGKLIGPSYKEVAAKYANTPANVSMLADKIINGGMGNWGEIPMAGHPNLSKQDAEAMVKYILSIK